MQFKKTNFWNLLNNGIDNITIPIIQRAYTQGGRSGNPKIEVKGERFLKRLIEALQGNPITLDFVYGSNIKNKIYPLDGQQRLTTLFLLHWYIAQKENVLTDDILQGLKKFSYETRQSSRYFCEHLCEYKVVESKEKVSDAIKNQKWFMLSWEDDPSISSMLGMLDKIATALQNDENKYWESLTNPEINNWPITFFYTSLKDMNLTDDLYVKMNARGLELTDFEKLKAAFNQKIDNEKWDEGKLITEKFGHKIDTYWTDLFWKYKEKIEKKDNEGNVIIEYRIDDILINFIAGIAINCYAQNLEIQQNKEDEEKVRKELAEKGKTKNVTNEAVKRERIEKRITHLANHPNDVAPEDFPSINAFDYLVNCLDKYAEKIDVEFSNAELKTDISLWEYCSKLDSTLFKILIQNQSAATYKQRVLFYAQTNYLLNNSFDTDAFSDWMRVVRNIVENSTIDAATPLISAIGLINELAKGSADIYDYLSKTTIQSFAREQVKEEIEKSKIIVANPDMKQIIHKMEDADFCKGKIDFTLYCINYDIDNNPNPANFDEKKMEQIYKVIKNNFADMDTQLTDDFKRAFLTIKNNDYYEIWGSWSFSFDSHKRWLLNNNNDLKNNFTRNKDWRRDYLKDLFNLLTEKSYQQIIEDYNILPSMPNWKQRLIKEKSLLNNATFILIPNDNKYKYCLLAWQKRPSRDDQVKKIHDKSCPNSNPPSDIS
jgi:hypothetical protein